MLKTLKFVQGAVSKKDFLPALKHFVIENGTVRGYNGTLALCAPIPLQISCKPKADELVDAVTNCKEEIVMSMTATGRLRIKSGAYASSVDCVPDENTPHAVPDGEIHPIDGEAFMTGIKVLQPFIGDDASRQWSNGLLFVNQSVYATNNVIAAEYYMRFALPSVVMIPRDAIRELVRIDEAPISIQLARNSATFHYSDGRWLYTLLGMADQWPDIPGLIDHTVHGPLFPIDTRLFDGLEAIRKRVDKIGRVYFHNTGLSTVAAGDPDGSQYHVPDLQWEGIYNIDMLRLLEGVVEEIDWSQWPGRCYFTGAKKYMRGVMVGLKL